MARIPIRNSVSGADGLAHQGAFGDCLPIWNEKKDICLLFSGEDFTDRADIDALRMRGHEFSSDDASYLVHLYEEMGSGFLEKLNGWFSGILLDLREQKLSCLMTGME